MTKTTRRVVVLVIILATGAASFGQETVLQQPLSRRAIDQRIFTRLRQVLVEGVTVFNRGDHAECYRLFEGALLAVSPLIDHRPELQARIESELKRVEGLRSPVEKSFALRKVIDEVRAAIRKDLLAKAGKRTAAPAAQKNLWERLGGESAVRVLVKDFLRKALFDPKFGFVRAEQVQLTSEEMDRLEQDAVAFASSVLGGPLKYDGKDLKQLFSELRITEGDLMTLVAILVQALEQNRVGRGELGELVALALEQRKHVVPSRVASGDDEPAAPAAKLTPPKPPSEKPALPTPPAPKKPDAAKKPSTPPNAKPPSKKPSPSEEKEPQKKPAATGKKPPAGEPPAKPNPNDR